MKSKKKYKAKNKGKNPMNLLVGVIFFVSGYLFGVNFNYKDLSDNFENIKIKEDCSNLAIRFSPKGGCTDLIVETIEKAQNKILVQAYYFTSQRISDALIRAKNRGVQVSFLLDKSQLTHKYSKLKNFLKNKMPVYIDKVSGLSHNKIMIIDDKKVLTGSFNWTQGAENRNAENIVCISNKKAAEHYIKNWSMRKSKAKKL